MAASSEPRIVESEGPMDLSTPSKKSSGSPSMGDVEVDEEAGRLGVAPRDIDMTFLAAAPCSTVSSPAPLSKESSFDPVVSDPVFRTPVKRKQSQMASSTPTSADSQSSGTQAKKKKHPLPSPGKRYLQTQSQDMSSPQIETIEQIAEMVALGEVCHEPVKVSNKRNLYKFRT